MITLLRHDETTQLNDIDHSLLPRCQKWHWSRHQPSALPRPRPFSSLVIGFLSLSLRGTLVLVQLLLELFLPCVSLLWYVAPGGICSEFLPSKRFYFISVAEEHLCWCLGNCVQVLWYPHAVSPFRPLWRHGLCLSPSSVSFSGMSLFCPEHTLFSFSLSLDSETLVACGSCRVTYVQGWCPILPLLHLSFSLSLCLRM